MMQVQGLQGSRVDVIRLSSSDNPMEIQGVSLTESQVN